MTTERPQCLLICYYFPPWGMGGVQRPLKFAKYLGEFGWDLTVLTAAGAAYYKTDDTLLTDLPQTVRVIRIP
ncbi:MAG TPA: glycosyl transferase, partial [candidate division Zixibacteria bacterium]|nr:glycosyl transferase [candidate division Zixibacteria bacterium]